MRMSKLLMLLVYLHILGVWMDVSVLSVGPFESFEDGP